MKQVRRGSFTSEPQGRYCSQLKTYLTQIVTISSRPVDDAAIRDLTILRNNCEYLLLYLEATNRVDRSSVLALRRLYETTQQRSHLVDALVAAEPRTTEADICRSGLLGLATNPHQGSEMATVLDPLLAEADREDSGFLRDGGVNVPERSSAEAAYLREVANGLSSGSELAQSWVAQRSESRRGVLSAVDKVIEQRWDATAAAGYTSPATRTFHRFGVSLDEAEHFLDDYFVTVISDRRKFEREIISRLGPGNSTDDVPRLIRLMFDRERPTRFDADHVLKVISEVAERVLDVEIVWFQDSRDRDAHVLMRGSVVGVIQLEMLPPDSSGSVRSPRCLAGHSTIPSAIIACPHSVYGSVHAMTYRSTQTMLHEFGHALNHILIKQRVPSVSGLDYLPLERLDLMSTWFEQWILHPNLAETAIDFDSVVSTLRVIELLHRRSLVERGLYAALDLEMHAHRSGSIQVAFDTVVQRYGLQEQVTLPDVLPYLSWPMQQRNPGAEVSILFGWALAAASFRSYRKVRLEDIRAQQDPTLKLALDRELKTPSVSASTALEFLRR